jgi:hypothetical protein
MRVLHISFLNLLTNNLGYIKQLQDEIHAAKLYDAHWKIEVWTGDDSSDLPFIYTFPSFAKSRLSRINYFYKVLNTHSSNFEIIILRYIPLDFYFPLFRSKFAQILLVHHTKEPIAIYQMFSFFHGIACYCGESLLGFFSIRRADALIGVTKEIVDFEKKRAMIKDIPSFVYPNGIYFHDDVVLNDKRNDRVTIVFTSVKFFQWQGLNFILESILSNRERLNFEFHIIGMVPRTDNDIINKHNLNDRIILHDKLDESSIKNIYELSDVGLAAFNLKSVSLNEACTLKVREYLRYGLPVYSGHIDSGLPQNFPFYRVGPPNIPDICDYAHQMRGYSRKTIRDAARPFIDKSLLFNNLMQWLMTLRK